jgi:hypothetical protein
MSYPFPIRFISIIRVLKKMPKAFPISVFIRLICTIRVLKNAAGISSALIFGYLRENCTVSNGTQI